MHPKIEAKITLVLREQDVALLLKAVEQFNPENQAEARNRAYLLEVLEQLVVK